MSDQATTAVTTATTTTASTSATAALTGDTSANTATQTSATQTGDQAQQTQQATQQPAGLSLPGKDATPEQWSEFYGKLGRPEKSSDYGLKVRDGEDPAFVGQVGEVMHKYGLTKEQAVGLQADLMAKADERLAAHEQARVAALDAKNTAEQAELKSELGERFDGQIELAKRAVRQFAGNEEAADIITAIEDKIGYKATMKFFMGIGAGLGEHDANGQATTKPDAVEKKPTANILYSAHYEQKKA